MNSVFSARSVLLFAPQVAIVDFRQLLKGHDVPAKEADSAPSLRSHLLSESFDVLLYRCEEVNDELIGMLQFIRQHGLETKVVVNSLTNSSEEIVRVIKMGAADFVVSETLDYRVLHAILRCFEHPSPEQKKTSAAHPTDVSEPVLVGQSPAICEIRTAVNLVADSQSTALITGESGTGKEVIARLIHLQSRRARAPFIALNCAAMPKDVIESELFGHEKGAFTGAVAKKAGCFEMANGGTLFFDEIAEMSVETQAKLLRAIETRKFRRLSGTEEIDVDLRILAATNKSIANTLRDHGLREDLYYRLSVIEIFIPPLRERMEDIPLLVDYFLTGFSQKHRKPKQRFDSQCMEAFLKYDWPGNVREVRNVVERALVVCPHESIEPRHLPERLRLQVSSRKQISIPLGTSSQEAERILILETLTLAGNNKAKAAKILGMSRKTLHNKLLNFSRS